MFSALSAELTPFSQGLNLSEKPSRSDLPDFDPNNLSEAKIKHYIDIIKQKYITY